MSPHVAIATVAAGVTNGTHYSSNLPLAHGVRFG